MNVAGKMNVMAEISARVIKADTGEVVDLGVITSPYNDRLRNYLWKKQKEKQIRKALGR